jgi:hypothetical protein
VREEEVEMINEETKQGKGYSTTISPRETTTSIFIKEKDIKQVMRIASNIIEGF